MNPIPRSRRRVKRTWIAASALILGAAGLAGAFRLEEEGTNTAFIAAGSVGLLAAGVLLFGFGLGHAAARTGGGVVFVAGIAVIVTHHQVWYWLPATWESPVTLVAGAVAAVGLAVLLFAYGFSLAGLSGTLGVLAAVALVLSRLALPDVGSWEDDVLRVAAVSFGAIALTAGLGAATVRRPRSGGWRAGTALAGLVSATAVATAAVDSYDQYAPAGYRATVISAAAVGVAGAAALGLATWLRRRQRSTPMPPPAPKPPSEDAVGPPPTGGAGAAPAMGGPVTAPLPAGGVPSVAALASNRRLETAAAVVGLVTGVIAIARELYGVARAVLP